jgi:peptidoglycan L-alanyl-D-glutamate endopeptidase CwlK
MRIMMKIYKKILIISIFLIAFLIPIRVETAPWQIEMEIGLEKLNYRFKPYVQEFIKACSREGIAIWVYDTWRTKAKQRALHAQGRQPIDIVNKLRKEAGLEPITEQRNRHIITRKLVSPHNYGLAADFVPIVDGKPVWNDARLWEKCGKIAVRLGMEWGGLWKYLVDKPHIQMNRWDKFATFVVPDRIIRE